MVIASAGCSSGHPSPSPAPRPNHRHPRHAKDSSSCGGAVLLWHGTASQPGVRPAASLAAWGDAIRLECPESHATFEISAASNALPAQGAGLRGQLWTAPTVSQTRTCRAERRAAADTLRPRNRPCPTSLDSAGCLLPPSRVPGPSARARARPRVRAEVSDHEKCVSPAVDSPAALRQGQT